MNYPLESSFIWSIHFVAAVSLDDAIVKQRNTFIYFCTKIDKRHTFNANSKHQIANTKFVIVTVPW